MNRSSAAPGGLRHDWHSVLNDKVRPAVHTPGYPGRTSSAQTNGTLHAFEPARHTTPGEDNPFVQAVEPLLSCQRCDVSQTRGLSIAVAQTLHVPALVHREASRFPTKKVLE